MRAGAWSLHARQRAWSYGGGGGLMSNAENGGPPPGVEDAAGEPACLSSYADVRFICKKKKKSKQNEALKQRNAHSDEGEDVAFCSTHLWCCETVCLCNVNRSVLASRRRWSEMRSACLSGQTSPARPAYQHRGVKPCEPPCAMSLKCHILAPLRGL